MTIEKRYDGAWVISDMVNGYLVSRVYIGYTKKEAMRLFKTRKEG